MSLPPDHSRGPSAPSLQAPEAPRAGSLSSGGPHSGRLLDQLRERIRYLHYSIRTEDADVHWVRAFVRYHGLRHPRSMGPEEVQAFLSWLATERRVSVSTHRQALAALVFLYRHVFGVTLPWLDAIDRPQRKPRLPVVMEAAEVGQVRALLEGTHGVLARLLYGTGMRIAEALQLRTKDIDFAKRLIVMCCGKGRRRNASDVPAHIAPAVAASACRRETGGKDRVVMLPAALEPLLRAQMQRAHALWQANVRVGRQGVQMPDAIDRKYPRAGQSWAWFRVLPQATHSTCSRTGVVRRHHVYDQTFQRDFKRAGGLAGITRPRPEPVQSPATPPMPAPRPPDLPIPAPYSWRQRRANLPSPAVEQPRPCWRVTPSFTAAAPSAS